MNRFSYVRASSVLEAVDFLNQPGIRSKPLAGGTDLLLQLRSEPSFCDRVVDISRIPDLHNISLNNNSISIGAATTFNEIIANPMLQERAPVLWQACRQVGAVQIRNMGTLGGNVANAAACADSLPALVCLGAEARVVTPLNTSIWKISELVRGPNRTLIPTGGLLVSISFPALKTNQRSVFLKLGRRNAMSISRLTLAAVGQVGTDGRISEARIVPGAATPQIMRFGSVEDLLVGQLPSPQLYQKAAAQASQEMTRLAGKRWSSEFKNPALSAMVIRALVYIFEPLRRNHAA